MMNDVTRPDAVLRPALVSILVPAHNHERFVEECLESVAASGYPRLELLCIDDASTDNTFAAIVETMDSLRGCFERVHVSRHSSNAGVSRTLNELLQLAGGEFVVPLASDDRLVPDGISRRVTVMETRTDLLAVLGQCRLIDNGGNVLASSAMRSLYKANVRNLRHPGSLRRELLLRWSVPGPAALYRSSTFSEIDGVGLYDPDLLVEDRDFFLRLLAGDAVGFVDETVADYRIHDVNQALQQSASRRSHVVVAEQQNMGMFRGLDRFLLALVMRANAARLAAATDCRALPRTFVLVALVRLARALNSGTSIRWTVT